MDPDGCCAFRKTQALQRALAGFDAWITGRKRFQSATRLGLPVFEAEPPHIKINPLARWSTADLAAYATEHRLPPHPLVAEGFGTIGCAPCPSALRPGEEAQRGSLARLRQDRMRHPPARENRFNAGGAGFHSDP